MTTNKKMSSVLATHAASCNKVGAIVSAVSRSVLEGTAPQEFAQQGGWRYLCLGYGTDVA